MSDYVRKKVVRLPFPSHLLVRYETDDVYECFNKIKKSTAAIFKTKNSNGFDLSYSDVGYYIDWVYYYTYGEESRDFGNVRSLTTNELYVIKPQFDSLEIGYIMSNLRVVDYCYYNACEPPDYYELITEENDDSELFISK